MVKKVARLKTVELIDRNRVNHIDFKRFDPWVS